MSLCNIFLRLINDIAMETGYFMKGDELIVDSRLYERMEDEIRPHSRYDDNPSDCLKLHSQSGYLIIKKREDD